MTAKSDTEISNGEPAPVGEILSAAGGGIIATAALGGGMLPALGIGVVTGSLYLIAKLALTSHGAQ